MRNFFIAGLLVLRFFLGNAEAEEEEVEDFLYQYASYFGDYLYSTGDYFVDNTTLVPTFTYPYEYFQESVGSPLRCHLPFVILLSLVGFLL